MLKRKLLDRIAGDGPLPFEAFMEAALYDPQGGFFATGPIRSEKAGDFLTSPEVSPLFGETLAGFVAGEFERSGSPGGFTVVDAGAGSGSLLRPLLGSLTTPVDAWAVEASPAARARLAEMLPEERVVQSLDELPVPFTGVVIANELLDNLPAALGVRRGSSWRERWVGREGEELVLVDHPARPEVAKWCEKFAGAVPDGGFVEVQQAATAWVERALGCLRAGSVVVIDYGGTTEELEPRRAVGTLRTYRAHHLGPDPLTGPGETDITMDVNFSALAASARAAGAEVGIERQDDFLSRWGLRSVVSDLRRRELALARSGDATERLEVRSRRMDAETLLHPRGLGDFRVLVAVKGTG